MQCGGFSSELYDLYALGVLDGEEETGIDEHLRMTCDTCRQHISQSLRRAAGMALAVPSFAPPRHLRAKITASVRPAKTGFRAWLEAPAFGWAAAAIFAVVGLSGIWYLASESKTPTEPVVVSHVSPPAAASPRATLSTAPAENAKAADSSSALTASLSRQLEAARSESATLTRDTDEQRSRVAQLEAQLRAKDLEVASANQERSALQAQLTTASAVGDRVKELQNQLASYQQRLGTLTRQVEFYQTAIQSQRANMDRNTRLISLLSAPGLRVLDLQGTEQGGSASGRALLANNAPLVFFATKLPTLPAGRTFQLWVMRNKGRSVTSGGIFQADASQSAMLTVSNASGADGVTALAVTEEPAGGQPLPTGHKILIGTART